MRIRKNIINIKLTDRENERLREEAKWLETTLAQLIRDWLTPVLSGQTAKMREAK